MSNDPSPTADVFADTIAQMTWMEITKAIEDGAVALWSLGVIEQHGPHLPTGTDVYLPSARLRAVKAALSRDGVTALIIPPYYWGVNVVSGSFPASYNIKPETMTDVVSQVLGQAVDDGFAHVFCFSGHGDALHNSTIYQAVRQVYDVVGGRVSYVVPVGLAARVGLDPDDPALTVYGGQTANRDKGQVLGSSPSLAASEPGKFMDVHAGRWETSMMLASHRELVREDVRTTLASTDFGPDDLAEWRKGYDQARAKTPQGYLGDPASATAELGQRTLAASVQEATDAIVRRLNASK